MLSVLIICVADDHFIGDQVMVTSEIVCYHSM